MRPSARPLAALAIIVTGVGVGAFALAPAAQADTTTVTYFYSAAEQSFAIPANVTRLHVDAVGGQGGRSINRGNTDFEPGGAGAMVSADIDVTPNTTLFVEVGGNGQDGGAFSTGTATGGWNGGGAGGAFGAAGGGGASDVRTVSATTAGSLDSRVAVAAGGGGAAVGAPGGASGSPGGAPDPHCDGTQGGPGGAGTASQGGSGGTGAPTYANGQDGSQGSGGDGASAPSNDAGGGGGGGGYFGGGGGGAGEFCGGGGGGGSSHLSGTFSPPISDFGQRTWITISYVVPMKPLATTTPASDIGQTSATLNGVLTPETVTPPDSGAICHFEYGTDASYGRSTPGGSCGQGMGQVYFWETVTDLLPGTTYHYRLAASNRYGYSYGDDVQFTTLSPAPAPSATTSAATNIGQHKATLHGVVNPRGYATTYHFQYGTTASYGKNTANRSAGNGSSDVNVQAALSALPRHTTYHFRIVAMSVNGTTVGADRTFRTG